jgi:glycosyltransferase involved in cell wall biosynthesis
MSGQMPKVSVIVPMYNVERYLRQCVDSLLTQTLDSIEIVLVDDGSPDSCGKIADAYSARYGNVKSVHRNNGGLGPARNTGIEYASGEYIGFVDSDDWVSPEMFERLYGAAKQNDADVVVGGYEEWTDGKATAKCPHPLAGRTLDGAMEIGPYRRLLYGRLPHDGETIPFPVSVWIGVYRRNLIEDAGLCFHEVLSEDVFFNIDAWGAASRMTFIGNCPYRYRKDGQSSITRTFSHEKVKRYTDFFELLAAYAGREEESEECLLRAHRKMIDYSRSYVFMVEKSGLCASEKVAAVSALTDSEAFRHYCVGYPVNYLPRFQALFHRLLIKGHPRIALALTRARMISRGEQ